MSTEPLPIVDEVCEEREWPFASGAMARHVRTFNWSKTPLGPIQNWSQSFRSAVDTMLGCTFPASLSFGRDLIVLYNDAYIPLIGISHPKAFGRPRYKTFPQIRSTYQIVTEKVFRGESVLLKDHLLRYPRREDENNPEDFWFDLSYSPVRDDIGNVVAIFGIAMETTSRRKAEEARAIADQRLNRALETEAVGVIFFNTEGYITDANDVFLKMIGYTRTEMKTGMLHWRTLTPPEWVSASEVQMAKFFRTGKIGPYEKEYFMKNGSRRWMLFAGRDIGGGSIVEYAVDITDQKLAEQRSRAMEERFRAMVQASSDVIYRMSPDWKVMRQFRSVNQVADAEISEEEWLTRYIHPEDAPAMKAAIEEAIRTGNPVEMEHRILRSDGSLHWTFSRAIPLRNEHGEITEWFGTATDITGRKRAEEAVLRNEKLATLGRMVASIAHEINNPLEATTNLLYLTQSVEGMPAEAKQYLEQAESELKRVAHITRQSLGFYRESSAPLEASVNKMLEASIELLRGKIAAKNAIIDRQWDEEVIITAVPGELRQVFSNLLANSLDAIDFGGRIAIRVSKKSPATNPHVRITFADSGCGIDAAKRESIFDPFYSTKGNLGTGLGLWVTRQIIEKHRGAVRMRSSTVPPINGTVFSVTFPM